MCLLGKQRQAECLYRYQGNVTWETDFATSPRRPLGNRPLFSKLIGSVIHIKKSYLIVSSFPHLPVCDMVETLFIYHLLLILIIKPIAGEETAEVFAEFSSYLRERD